MNLAQYLQKIQQRYALGNATEHTFRGDLQLLIESLCTGVAATNEPKRIKCGAPDYILTRKDIPLGYIEAKDIGDKDLEGAKKTGNKEQFDRYKGSLNNLIFTDYLDFHFYKNGNFTTSVKIGEVQEGKILALPENFPLFETLLQQFVQETGQTILSPTRLAEMMAGKAKLLANVIEQSLDSDEENTQNSQLKSQYAAFQQVLMHDLTHKGFADMYAQTIAYGMFAARYHDRTLENFSREEAARLIPHSNPFLRKLFQTIAGYDLDTRIVWLVDDLVQIFLASDVAKIMGNFGKSTRQEDPIIHFYETFLSEYDPALRKSRGVWYTPEPVVNFIVRAVDEILKTEFGLTQGLADTSKTKVKVATQNKSGKLLEKEVHRVQILDPATGTGTFLAEVVKFIHKKYEKQQGIWKSYVEKDLLPRLNGFELLMTSYAMAHLKLDILLSEKGYKSGEVREGLPPRFRIYLTNSLEEAHENSLNLFSQWLSQEADEANAIKRDSPVMCVIGNPPYSGISSNNGEWITKLIDDYKYVDGVHFNERKHWLNDDYVKFLRYGQHFIEKNGSGIVAFINPHGFLDNPTFRGMRWHLLKTYDKIFVLDLHGNSKKKETCPDGSPDVNVFDIMQGVSINIFIKTGKKKADELGRVFHFDLYGKREVKYDFLANNSFKTVAYKELNPEKPNLFFVPKNNEGQGEYEKGFGVNELFTLNNTGIVTGIDRLSIFMTRDELNSTVNKILTLTNPYDEYKIKDSRRTTKEGRVEDLRNAYKKGIIPISYRPFDIQFTLPFEKNEYWINSPRTEIMQHFLKGENVGLVTARQCVGEWQYVFCTKLINEFNLTGTAGRFGSGNTFPLYLYPSESSKSADLFSGASELGRVANLNREIVARIAEGLGLRFTPEKESGENSFAPIDILDYIYAVLHSPTYREKYKEFLKIDFPRVPYPKTYKVFKDLIGLGGQLRQIHLLESPKVEDYITSYPEDGDNVVGKVKYQDGKVYINDTQYFEGVPEVAWNFYIGGYQPAQKWLKDRKERVLDFEDIFHYQKIIVALSETHRIMQEIDTIEIE